MSRIAEKLLSSTTFPTRQMMGGETVVAPRSRAIEITTKTGPRKTPYRHYIQYKRCVYPYVLVTLSNEYPKGHAVKQKLKHRVRHRFLHATKGWREFSNEGGMLNRMAHTARQEAQKLAAGMPA